MVIRTKLADICSDVSYGYTASAEAEDVGPKFLRITDIQGGVVNWPDVPYCKIDDRQLSKNLLEKGDIVVARTGNSTGENYIYNSDEKSVFASYLIRFRVNQELANPYFVWLQMRTHSWWGFVSGSKSGSAQAGANAKVLGLFEVELPERQVQDEIASLIFDYFNKIELNKQTNQTLEQMAQALFKSWFVDFDPVIDNALTAGNPIPDELQERAKLRKSVIDQRATNPKLKPLPDHIQQLFPSEFEESELGWIPKSWTSGVLASVAKYSTNRMDGSELTLENYISTENMLTDRQGVTKASSIPELKSIPSFIKGQVLISNIRPYFKKIWLATSNGGRSNDVLGFESLEPKTETYLMNLLSQDQFFDFMMTTSKGSKMPRGDKKAIMDWGVVVPSVQIREFYSKLVGNFYSANSIRIKESDSLVQLRDTLLPKLISGELDLSQLPDKAN